jgi:DNA-binding transcriptional LysR family regulator
LPCRNADRDCAVPAVASTHPDHDPYDRRPQRHHERVARGGRSRPGSVAARPARCQAFDLCTADLIAVVHPGHELAQRDFVEPQDILPYRLISFSRSLPIGALVEKAFREARTPRRIAIKVNQSSVACALARAGAGVAVINTNITCLKFRPRSPINAQLLVSKNAPLSRAARMFITSMRTTVRLLQSQGFF